MAGDRPGRETKLTRELRESVVAGVLEGVDPDVAAQAEGVGRATYYEWMQRGKNGEEPFAEFRNEVARACAESEKKLVNRWLSGDEKGESFGRAKAAAEFLRLTKRRYGEKVRVQVADELQELLSVVERVCSREDFARVLEAIAARDRGETLGDDSSDRAEPIH